MNRPWQDHCRIVLVRPSQPGNIGAVARIMYNFGLKELVLIQSEVPTDAPEAIAMATHGLPILQSARCCHRWEEAVGACHLVFGTSARLGGLFRTQSVVTPRAFFPAFWPDWTTETIALVFGPERTGLLTEEISQCHYLLTIPAAVEYPVLNLAQAVACCLYELFQVGLEQQLVESTTRSKLNPVRASHHTAVFEQSETKHQSAPFATQERMFLHLEAGLRAIHFLWNEKADAQMHALRHLIGRAQPSMMEVQLLHGIARQLIWYAEHAGKTKVEAEPPKDET